ncbi:MDM34 family protein CYBJADRAFT_169693 [Cyberlindnera jadinii NRRL Y-1542]|uniref:SMP-LTD domain-containing protein n=1 Tax=Cyberlindnera jadinii (strain ATCC 18201 / CBS 1600 / BCRC 20928 / JCM 3617 / NBRC 0987 / NRRL Y-1542) TaxID=983966 RepID=A0A1E4RUU3_CYBJN|nr:hypothetical protein CYBJADRAFT_169693 [Cyberlindnera jadinii NRRL Y-1542]ODV71043.1 hypothetical protein CYBJADRAFT_169693 [Cyberlindnera jadinii NRRL Y-1542]
MSFLFDWMSLHSLDLKSKVNSMLEHMSIPHFPDKVSITELLWGDSKPVFELLDIVELTEERFKGLFKFEYSGELKVVLRSNIEINAINLIDYDDFTKPHYVLANCSTVLPVDFTIDKLRLDLLFTVVTKGDNVTVVFNDEPMVDLEIHTTIDELLDDDLFEMLKTDALNIVTEYLKQDLPGMIARSHHLEEHHFKELERMRRSYYEDDEFERDCTPLTLPQRINTQGYDTLSLKASGVEGVVQRISLSQPQYQQESTPVSSTKKRRTIKMRTRNRKTTTCNTPKLDPTTETQHSHLSSPTLLNGAYETNGSLDEYLKQETLVLSDTLSHLDPYESLTHPMDIDDDDDDNSSTTFMINEKLMRPRAFSSNYINLS